MKKDDKIICNACRKVILERNTLSKTDYLHVEKEWGYFSDKDGQKHEFDLCEACYDIWIKKLQIPITVKEVTELV